MANVDCYRERLSYAFKATGRLYVESSSFFCLNCRPLFYFLLSCCVFGWRYFLWSFVCYLVGYFYGFLCAIRNACNVRVGTKGPANCWFATLICTPFCTGAFHFFVYLAFRHFTYRFLQRICLRHLKCRIRLKWFTRELSAQGGECVSSFFSCPFCGFRVFTIIVRRLYRDVFDSYFGLFLRPVGVLFRVK